jgi:hypothetical protein
MLFVEEFAIHGAGMSSRNRELFPGMISGFFLWWFNLAFDRTCPFILFAVMSTRKSEMPTRGLRQSPFLSTRDPSWILMTDWIIWLVVMPPYQGSMNAVGSWRRQGQSHWVSDLPKDFHPAAHLPYFMSSIFCASQIIRPDNTSDTNALF